MDATDGQITLLLGAMKEGDRSALGKLLPLIYTELHKLAKSYMQKERSDHTLQPTALLNEAYMRLAGDVRVDWQGRKHFIAVAANIMRHVLVDHARAHNAVMRGGDVQKVEFEEAIAISRERSSEVLALNDALNQLEKVNPRQSKVVELRYFAGLSVEEISGILNMSPRSVKREWAVARLWLFKEIQQSRPDALAEEKGSNKPRQAP